MGPIQVYQTGLPNGFTKRVLPAASFGECDYSRQLVDRDNTPYQAQATTSNDTGNAASMDTWPTRNGHLADIRFPRSKLPPRWGPLYHYRVGVLTGVKQAGEQSQRITYCAVFPAKASSCE